MFSVNIDKLVNMTANEVRSYNDLMQTIGQMLKSGKSLAVIGNGLSAFKLAYKYVKEDKKVLFIDGDVSSDVFLGKYKLGKNMKGVMDYLKNPGTNPDIICYTNEEKLNIVFTGMFEDGRITEGEMYEMKGLLSKFGNDYDMIIVDADIDGKLARYCDGTIVVYKQNEFGEISAERKIDELEAMGCTVFGVVIHE